MGPQALRMNLNTLARHEVCQDNDIVGYVANRIADADEIRRARQFPYQYLAAYLNAGDDVPQKIKAALHRAAEIACGNVPELPGPVVIGLDTSGSMSSPVTGHRGRGATTKMRCVDVAALFAAAILRRNPDSIVVPFDMAAYEPKLDPQDTILSLAERLAKYGGGGTDCSLPLREGNTKYRERVRGRCAGERQRELGLRWSPVCGWLQRYDWRDDGVGGLRQEPVAAARCWHVRPQADLHRPAAVLDGSGPRSRRHLEHRRLQ